MSELKPCPFCDGEAELDWGSTYNVSDGMRQDGWVECKSCEASVEIFSIDDNKSTTDLTNKWNQRAETETEKRLTSIATKHATRADELYEFIEALIEGGEIHYTALDNAIELLDKSRKEAEQDNG